MVISFRGGCGQALLSTALRRRCFVVSTACRSSKTWPVSVLRSISHSHDNNNGSSMLSPVSCCPSYQSPLLPPNTTITNNHNDIAHHNPRVAGPSFLVSRPKPALQVNFQKKFFTTTQRRDDNEYDNNVEEQSLEAELDGEEYAGMEAEVDSEASKADRRLSYFVLTNKHQLAVQTFETIQEPTKLDYDNALRAYATLGDIQNAERLFRHLEHSYPTFTAQSLGSLANILSRTNRADEFMGILENYYNAGRIAVQVLLTFLIRGVAELRGKAYDTILRIFDFMRQKNIPVNLHAYNCAAIGLGHKGKYANLLRLLEVMKAEGIEPDHTTYNSLITAYNRGDQCDKAIELFNDIKERRINVTISGYMINNIIEVYCKKLDVESAAVHYYMALTYGMMVTQENIRRLLLAFEYKNDGNSAYDLFRHARRRYLATPRTLVTALSVLIKCNCPDLAISLYEDQRRSFGIRDTTAILNNLIQAYYMLRDYDNVLDAYQRFSKRGWSLTKDTAEIMIDVLIRRGELDAAMEIYKTMRTKFLKVSEATYIRLLNAFSAQGLDQCVTLLNEAKTTAHFNIGPRMYALVLEACIRWGYASRAYELLDEMRMNGVRVTDEVYYKMIVAFTKYGSYKQANDVLLMMRNDPAKLKFRKKDFDFLNTRLGNAVGQNSAETSITTAASPEELDNFHQLVAEIGFYTDEEVKEKLEKRRQRDAMYQERYKQNNKEKTERRMKSKVVA